jgi:hypothetical protein
MVRGPQGIFARIPGLGTAYRLLTAVVPLGIGKVIKRRGKVYVE